MGVRNRALISSTAIVIVLGWSDIAAATSYEYCRRPPREPLIELGIALTIALLMGFVERPFYSRAGVKRHALAISLAANLISLVLFRVMGFFAALGVGEFGLAVLPVGFIAIIAFESRLAREFAEVPLEWSEIVVGNFVSLGVVGAIYFFAALPIGERLCRHLLPYEQELAWSGIGLCAGCGSVRSSS